MGGKSYMVAIVVAVTVNFASAQDPTSFQDIFWNVTLETNNNTVGWDIPGAFPKWLEYYTDTTLFKKDSENGNTCASIPQDFNTLSETEGIWVACQDSELPPDCASQSDCHPTVTYNSGTTITPLLRTIRLSFALYGLAILRLSAAGKCFDYSYRQDTFSPCEFLEVNSTMVADGWIYSQFIFDVYSSIAFNTFSLEMIARFAHDVVLLDKVEASMSLVCGDALCTTTPTPPTTSGTSIIWMPITNATTTTEEDGISDPDVIQPTTTPRSSSSMICSSSIVAFNFTVFLIRFLISL